MSAEEVVAIALAAWRISRLLGQERGPFGVFARLREAVGIDHDMEGRVVSWTGGELAQAMVCPACRTLWVGAGLVVLVVAWGPAMLAVWALAATAGALIVHLWFKEE